MRNDPSSRRQVRQTTSKGRMPRIGERGYVLLTMSPAAIVLFGVLGMAVDIGRMFIGKSEVQAFSDSIQICPGHKQAVCKIENQWIGHHASCVLQPGVTPDHVIFLQTASGLITPGS